MNQISSVTKKPPLEPGKWYRNKNGAYEDIFYVETVQEHGDDRYRYYSYFATSPYKDLDSIHDCGRYYWEKLGYYGGYINKESISELSYEEASEMSRKMRSKSIRGKFGIKDNHPAIDKMNKQILNFLV
jgi:hypothetical protein